MPKNGKGEAVTVYVLLTDNDDGYALVACPSGADATSLASTAIFNDGDVLAWRVPDSAITDWERVREILRDGGGINEIEAAVLHEEPRRGY
jgi:hypothetical protein